MERFFILTSITVDPPEGSIYCERKRIQFACPLHFGEGRTSAPDTNPVFGIPMMRQGKTRVQRDRPLEVPACRGPVEFPEKSSHASRGIGFSKCVVELQRLIRKFFCFREAL